MSVAIRVDAGPVIGVGHLMRCLALAEELISRGIDAHLLGDVGGLEFAAQQVASRGLTLHPADDAAIDAQCAALGATHAIIDGYQLPSHLGRTLRAAGVRVATLVDGAFGTHQDADLYIDQNLGAHADPAVGPMLAGIDYAIVNDRVRSRRGQARAAGEVPRVLVVFGGTDAYDGAPVLVDCLRATREACDIVVIAPKPETRASLHALAPVEGQSLQVLTGVADLPGLAVTCDLVVSAAGTSLWELMCLGLAVGAVCVVDNQLVGYDRVLEAEVVVPIGLLDPIRRPGPARDRAIVLLREAVTDADLRARLAQRGSRLVDGDGRGRVIDALLSL